MLEITQQIDEKGEGKKKARKCFMALEHPGEPNLTLSSSYTCVVCGNSDHNFLYCFPVFLRAHLETKGSSWQGEFTVPSGTPAATPEVSWSSDLSAVLNKCKIFSHKLLRQLKPFKL